VFRVGVVGHRPDRLQSADLQQLAAQLRSVLGAIRSEVSRLGRSRRRRVAPASPVLQAISPLAEGVDRLFAEVAIGLGYELQCPMPFPQAEFERDFLPPCSLEPDSLERFRSLLAQAERETALARLEMNGDRARASDAYAACGRIVVDQSDVLVVVWDGERRRRRGGTEETIDAARLTGVPIVWMDARAPHGWQLVEGGARLPASTAGRARRAGPPDLQILRKAVRDRTTER
jgi:hypothetical protein